MKDDINTYTFDFAKDVTAFWHELQPASDGIMFVETKVVQLDDTGDELKIILSKTIVGEGFGENDISKIHGFITDIYAENPEEVSIALTLKTTDGSVRNALSLNNSHPHYESLGVDNKHLMQLFGLYHETAHLLIPGGPNVDKDHPFQECVADAFAALCLLQRFGQDAVPFLSMFSWLRSCAAITYKDTGHLSTPVLDRIIVDSASSDFSVLTVVETMERAEAYATAWTPDESMLTEARASFAAAMQDKAPCLDLIADTCLNAGSDFSFYIAAKFFQPFLHPDGIVYGGSFLKLSPESRQAYADQIGPQAAGLTLRRVFNKAAPKPGEEPQPSLARHLEIPRPQGRQPFIYNP